MLICPIQDGAVLKTEWIRMAPRISQWFGEDATAMSLLDDYNRFGLRGHNGLDLPLPIGTPIYAPMSGIAKIANDGEKKGYGLHLKIRNKTTEVVLAHLSKIEVLDGAYVSVGDAVCYSGNSGFSTGAHLHYGMRFLTGTSSNYWDMGIKDYNNGYKGAVDPAPFTIRWKGSLIENTL